MKKIMLNFFALALIFVLAFAGTNPAGYEVGDLADDFSLENVDGEWVSLSDFEDANGYIVIFTCNTCPVAKKYEDRIIALNEKYAPMGYPVVAIMPNDTDIMPGDSMEKMAQRAEEKGYSFPYLIDADQTVFPKYGATKTPHVYLLNSERVVKYIGAIDNNMNSEQPEEKYVEAAIASLEAGNDPDPASTKAVGCSIKVKKEN